MGGRLSYYFQKFKRQLQTDGLSKTISGFWEFLVRRKFFLQFAVETFEYQVLSRFRSINATLISVLYQDLLKLDSKRILIYVSFDSQSELRDHVLQQLTAFHSDGYAIVFVTTSDRVTSEQILYLKESCALIAHRKNEGYDFGSWKLGYELSRGWVNKADSVIMMNDSCLGPYFDLGPSLEKMRSASDSVYGITKSYEITEYIQSYFFHFGYQLIHAGLVDDFFSRIRILNTKWGIVRFFEIGSSRMFKARGVPILALVDPKEPAIAEKMKQSGQTEASHDPTASWLIERKVNPFYKRSNLS